MLFGKLKPTNDCLCYVPAAHHQVALLSGQRQIQAGLSHLSIVQEVRRKIAELVAPKLQAFVSHKSKTARLTMLHLACQYLDLDFVKCLLRCNATCTMAHAFAPLDMALHSYKKPGSDALSEGTSLSFEQSVRDLAEHLLFEDYTCRAEDNCKKQRYSEPIVHMYHDSTDYHGCGLPADQLVAVRDVDGKTLLHWTAIYGIYEDVKWLLNMRANRCWRPQLG